MSSDIDMLLPFAKMHGLGNDFVVINALDHGYSFTQDQIRQIANRHIGIGCDQLLILEPSQHANFFCRIFNADGSEAEQCGNGLRCIARYVHENHLITGNECSIETKAGIFPAFISDYQHIAIALGKPKFLSLHATVKTQGVDMPYYALQLGNPHAVVDVTELPDLDLLSLATLLNQEPAFSQGANVGFVTRLDKSRIALTTIERGAGFTLACGSNASAAAVIAIHENWVSAPCEVVHPYGSLFVHWTKESKTVHLIGAASHVFNGTMRLKSE